MRVLVTTIPGLGHFHPMVPLARALVEAGHEVRVACSKSFSPYVSGAGLDAFSAGPDWVESEADSFYPGFTGGTTGHQLAAFAEIPKKGLVDDLVALAEAWRPDVVVHDHLEFGGWLAAELLGIPNVPFAMTIRVLEPGVLQAALADQMKGLLEHFRLPPDSDLTRPSRWLYLDLIPPSFAGLLFAPGRTVHHLRYVTDDRTGDEELPVWVRQRRGRPLVYATLGTIFNRLPGVLPKVISGAASLDVDVVVTTGRNVAPESLGDLPENVHATRYIPQADLIPHCQAIVCHGGFNTVFAGLSCGVPAVVVPLSADQPVNAFLCDQNGFGVSCTTELPEGSLFPLARPEDLTADQVAAALSKVLEHPEYANAARKLQHEIAAQPGPEHGVELLEQLAATGEPVVNSTRA